MFGGSASAVQLDTWVKLEVPMVRQKQTKWCWAACCESFTGFYGQHLKLQNEYILLCQQGFQQGMAERVHHGEKDLNEFAIPTQYFGLLKTVMGQRLNLSEPGRGGDVRPARDSIKLTLQNGRIFIFTSGNHARILCGYGVPRSGTEEGLYCMDPERDNLVWQPWSLYDSCTSLIWAPKGAFS
jgi:hypothetical protein